MSLIDPTALTPQQIAEARFAQWELASLDATGQEAWFAQNLIPHLIGLLLQQDLVEMLVVAEPLADALRASLETPAIPGLDSPFVQSLQDNYQAMFADEASRAALAEDLRQVALRLEALPVADMAVKDTAGSTEADQFIRIVTRSMRVRESVYQWANGTGFMELLRQSNMLLVPSYAELRQLYFVDRLLELRAASSVNLKQAHAGPTAFGG